MSGDPSRRPSNDRIRVSADVNAVVWVECFYCLGDGWHFPVRDSRHMRKARCGICDGLGARQRPLLLCGRSDRLVSAPRGWASNDRI